MREWHEVTAGEFSFNPFTGIGQDWMLIAAEREGRVNAMTASWGGVGVMWGKNAAFIFVRKSRFTKEFIDASENFSLTFFERPKYAGMLSYMGKTSGRTEDKIAAAGLTVLHDGAAPYFAEASAALICRKMCRQLVSPENFLDASIDARWYADHDYHDMYIGEITRILVR